MPASRPPRNPTPSTAATSPPGRRACRSPSISPPIAAMTAIIRASPAMSARRASRSTRVEDMKILFDGIPLDRDVGLDDDERRGDPGPRLLHRRGRGAGRRRRPARRAPSRTTSSRSSWSATPISTRPSPAMRIVARHHRLYCSATCRSSTRSRSRGYHMHEAGATAVQELAFTLADGMEYVRAALAPGARHRRVRRRGCASSSASA